MKPDSPIKKILLLRSTGLLGCILSKDLEEHGYEVHSHGLNKKTVYKANLIKFQETNELVLKTQPDLIINLVALTDVDLCEREPNLAYLLNIKTVENIVASIKKLTQKCHLIHLSTDQVYDGIGLHSEPNVALKNYYAFSKYASELAALNVSSTILRTNFFGRSICEGRSSITDWIFNSLKDKKNIQVFDDILFSPLSINSLCKMIRLCIEKKPVGIFNLGAHSGMSKSEFAHKFATKCGFSTTLLNPVSIKSIDFLAAYRPKDMRLNCASFQEKMNIELPSLLGEIEVVAKDYI